MSETKSLYLRETKKADETVIGWLKFRRNTPLIPSAKEQSVNNAFVREHLTTQGFPPLFVLFTESVNESEGHWIRGVKYKAFSSVPEHNAVLSLEGVPLDVSNVEATSGKEYGEFKAHNNIKLPQQTLDATRLSVSSLERYMDTLTEEARRLAEEIYKTEEVIRLGKK